MPTAGAAETGFVRERMRRQEPFPRSRVWCSMGGELPGRVGSVGIRRHGLSHRHLQPSEEMGGADACFWISKLQPLLKTHRARTVMRLRPRGLGSLGSTTCPGGRRGTGLHGSLGLGVSDLEADLNTCSSLSKCMNLTRVSASLCLSRCFHEMRLRYIIVE